MEAYLTLTDADALAATLLGLTHYQAADDATRSAALLTASIEIDAASRWQGRKYDPDQAREFPRVPYEGTVWDWVDGYAVVPDLVRIAVLRQADFLLDTVRRAKLAQIEDGLASQSVGSISESYARPTPAGQASGWDRLCSEARDLLARYRLTSGPLR